jgi:NAD(P)-dependent dehydrogenase (short-subunit alcohol dehydrogenase family)
MTRILEGRTAIITGANQGMGLEIACHYVKAGANVLLCARNGEVLEDARKQVESFAEPNQAVVAQVADVSKVDDVKELVDGALAQFSQIHILVNNAGVYGPKGLIEDVDWESWVHAIEVNLFGSILMCRAVLPHFKAWGYGKIVQLSGGGATSPMPRLSAYAASKAAIVRFVETLAEEVRDDHVDVNAIAPGALNTRLLDEIIEAGPENVGQVFFERSVEQKTQGGTPLGKGAELATFLGSATSDGITGKLISAVWDPWEDLPLHLDALNQTDVYALRRIVPQDRGMDWGER